MPWTDYSSSSWNFIKPLLNCINSNCKRMKWITRERPKIDRIACPWLIRRFIDQDAEIIYVPFEEVINKARELSATPFDIPGVEFTHYGTDCTFDYFIKKYK